MPALQRSRRCGKTSHGAGSQVARRARTHVRELWPPGDAMTAGEVSCRGDLNRRPGDVLAVQLLVAQTAVEDAHQSIGDDPQRLIVSLLSGTLEVVVAPGSGRRGDGGEGPSLAGISQPVVADEPRQHHLGPAGSLGDGRGAGVVLARLTIVVAVRIVSELGQCPGAEDGSKSWQTEV